MSYTYATWVSALLNEVAAYSSDPNWTAQIPTFIDYAEQRIYRDLDILNTRVVDKSLTLSSGTANYTLPNAVGNFIVVEDVWVLNSTAIGTFNTQNPVTPISLPFMSFAYPVNPNSSNWGLPEFYCWYGTPGLPVVGTNPQLYFGPTPDQSYPVYVQGTVRPTPLSSGNPNTILTAYYPDLWFAATMISAAAFMRNFGSQADNPAQAVSWEAQYKTLLMSADIEEARKQFRSQAWGTEEPRAVTAPPRV